MFYVVVVAFLLGVALASMHPLSLATALWGMSVATAIAIVSRKNTGALPTGWYVGFSLSLLALSVGLFRTEWHRQDFAAPTAFTEQIGEEIVFSGVVVAEPDERARTQQLQVASGGERLLVTVDRHTTVQYGDEIVVAGTLEVPESFETDLGRTFDYPGYLQARGIRYRVSFADIVLLSEGGGNPVIASLLAIKQQLMTGIQSVIPEPQAGLASGLLLGVKQALGEDVETAFRKSGIIHIVVLSGYNVMLVVAFIMFFLAPLPPLVRLSAGLAAITGFALLVGLSATVVRATIMAGLFLVAQTFSKQYDVLRILCLAGVIMVLSNPYVLLFDIGFQLSFMATLGLILVAPRLETAVLGGGWFGVKQFFVATVATQIAVLPLLLYHIGEVSLVAVVVNMLVLPIVPMAMLASFVAGLAGWWLPAVAPSIAMIANVLLMFIIVVADYFAAIPLATFIVPAFSPYVLALGYAALAFIWWSIYYRRLLSPTTLTGWEIVSEETLEKRQPFLKPTEKAAGHRPAAPDDTPVFFR